jgi:hypothetical protein
MQLAISMSFTKKHIKETSESVSFSSIGKELLHWKYIACTFFVAMVVFMSGFVWSRVKEVAKEAGSSVINMSSQIF